MLFVSDNMFSLNKCWICLFPLSVGYIFLFAEWSSSTFNISIFIFFHVAEPQIEPYVSIQTFSILVNSNKFRFFFLLLAKSNKKCIPFSNWMIFLISSTIFSLNRKITILCAVFIPRLSGNQKNMQILSELRYCNIETERIIRNTHNKRENVFRAMPSDVFGTLKWERVE